MTKEFLDESRMTSLSKAKAVIHMAELKPLAEAIGTSYQVIKNYRSKPELLDKASWKRVETMAQIYDAIINGDHRLEATNRSYWHQLASHQKLPTRPAGLRKSIRELSLAAATKKIR